MSKPDVRPISFAKLMKLPVHPLAELLPMADDETLDGIADDVGLRGFRPDRPIILLDGMILDGRNRREACRRAREKHGRHVGDAYVKDWANEAGSPLDFVVSDNVLRRHLTTSQKALVGANLANWANGMNQHTVGSEPVRTQKQVAGMLGISERIIQQANRVREHSDELVQKVVSGELKVKQAEALIELGDKELSATLAQDNKAVVARAKEIRTANKAAGRAARETNINKVSAQGGKQMPALPQKQYPVLYVDAPWENTVWGEETGNDKSPPYPTMTDADIKALCAGDQSPALDDAVCFFWTTSNRLDLGIDVLRAWGFDYVAAYFWDKQHMGMGRWGRDQVEVLLIGKRGNIPAPAPQDIERNLYSEKKGRHSVKPVHFAEMIDRFYPTLAKLELFQRKQSLVKGDIRLHRRKQGRWAFWGFEATGAATNGKPLLRSAGQNGEGVLSEEGLSASRCEGKEASQASPCDAPTTAREGKHR